MIGQGLDHTYGTKSPPPVFGGVRNPPAPTRRMNVSLNLRSAINVANMPTILAGYSQSPPNLDNQLVRRNTSVPAILPAGYGGAQHQFSAMGSPHKS